MSGSKSGRGVDGYVRLWAGASRLEAEKRVWWSSISKLAIALAKLRSASNQ